MKKKNSFGSVAGRIWSQYSFIFVLIIIMIAYSFTISANGNTFKWVTSPRYSAVRTPASSARWRWAWPLSSSRGR